MRINNNISALNAWRNLTFTDMAMGKNLEKLSSGLRINRAADDAAGLAISEQMRGQIRGLNQAVRNAQDGISLIQTAEGALTESHAILQRMRELAVQAANDTYTDADRSKLQQEVNDLIDELDRIAETTQFNSKVLLDGTYGSTANLTAVAGVHKVELAGAKVSAVDYQISWTAAVGNVTQVTVSHNDPLTGGLREQTIDVTVPANPNTVTANFDSLGIKVTFNDAVGSGIQAATDFVGVTSGDGFLHVGANEGENIAVSVGNMTAAELLGAATLDISTTRQDANDAIDVINDAINKVSAERAQLGAKQNRLEHTIANLSVAAENLTAAESRIRDVDMAQEMTKFTRNQILLQAGTAMLAQANMAPQSVLQLLR